MKQVILVAFLMTLVTNQILSQSFELGFATGIGIASNNIDGQSEWIENEIHSNLRPTELILNYQFLSNKTIKPFIGSSLIYSNKNFESIVVLSHQLQRTFITEIKDYICR